ncbi:ATPase, V1 complex, subunit F, eukaryotic [Corchorus olitorius]|uniref:ATPase, V1 complex, subunit F, eukaryotic n=1 Tax=Corchorus olitorius TaxID=93759 RepID=A0A1R3KM66_9ROSI|nr:ATPase, V1 complex, subunit F, eukaryotic [Corchorus olitorius]
MSVNKYSLLVKDLHRHASGCLEEIRRPMKCFEKYGFESENVRWWMVPWYLFSCFFSETTVKAIEDAFKEFTTREDVAIILISQYVANMIRFLVDSYNNPIPAILEIPSKDHPYDPAHDSVLSRVKYLFSTESVASGRY